MIPTREELDTARARVNPTAGAMHGIRGDHLAYLLDCEQKLRDLLAGLDDSRDRSVIGGTCALMHAESAARALIGSE